MSFWGRLWGRRRLEAELAEELDAHMRLAVADRIAHGESRAEAERAVRREFGNRLMIHETTRDMWGWTRLEHLVRDGRYALRQIRRSPAFSLISVLTLALGLGATTVLFSIVNSVLLEPMKYQEPGRLYLAVNLPSPRAPSMGYWNINARHFHEWREQCRACEDLAMADVVGFTLTGWGEPQRFPGLRVSSNFFRTLGVHPALGRDFRPEEELPGQHRELILTDRAWRSNFSADPGVIGRKLQINGEPFTVIGVMPPDLQLPVGPQWGPPRGNAPQPWMFRPLGLDTSRAYGDGMYNYVSVVRLKPGATPAQAVAQFSASISDIVRQYNIGLRPALLPLRETVTRSARAALWLLLGTVAAVLLIVCVNIGNLMLVRTAGRSREAGIRMALGSGRGELFRLVLSEAIIVVAAGAALGTSLAYAGLKALVAAAPVDLPRIGEVRMDARVVVFALAAALVSALICGLAPAWRLSRTSPNESLKSGSAATTASTGKLRFRELLVSAEVALSTVLLIVGGLLELSFYRVMQTPKGFDPAHAIAQDLSLIGPKYRDPADQTRFLDRALPRLSALPGVRFAGVTNQLPLRGETWICNLFTPASPGVTNGRTSRAPENVALANFRFVSPGYWQAAGIPLVKGRFLEWRDRDRNVAVLSEKAAETLWPGQDPIGRRVGGCGGESQPPVIEVVGVVGEVRAGAEKESPLTVYQPYWHTNTSRFFFLLRTEGDPLVVAGGVRSVIRTLDPDVPIPPATLMREVVDDSVAMRRFETELAVSFAAAALLFASLGLYGVISFAVTRRTPEIGIRVALGAHPADLIAMVVRQGMTPTIVGLAVGLAAALAGGRLIASQLFGVTPRDPLALAAVAGLLLAVAFCACWLPARRAARIDPLRALRFE